MPVIQRGPVVLAQRQNASPRYSADSDDTLREHILVLGDDYEKPQKEMDFPSAKLVHICNNKMKSGLRINTHTTTGLHERYMSSEEEPSPSPDSEYSHDEELKHKPSATLDGLTDLFTSTESEPAIAIAVPIRSPGRPKLVDITKFAPMHKRKQRIPKSQMLHGASKVPPTRVAAILDENAPIDANEAAEITTSAAPPQPKTTLKRKESQLLLIKPSSWLPEDEAPCPEEEQYLPRLELRRIPSYHDYDPYFLDPPRLTSSPRGNVSRTRGNTAAQPATNYISGWKGFTRSFSLAKKPLSSQQVAKKPKMIARGADEREEPLVIPPFPFEEVSGFA